MKCMYCQVVEYRFSPRNDNFVDTLLYSDFYNKLSWVSTQKNITDSSFIFTKIFCITDTSDCCNVTFKIDSSGNWYIIEAGKEVVFFDNTMQSIEPIYLEQCNKDILTSKKQKINNVTLYEFEIKTREKISLVTTYWFNERYGIIAVRGQFCLYVRDDFIELELN